MNKESRTAELLKMEYQYLNNSFISNEDMGEKRVSLFMTLTAGLGAAVLVALDKLSDRSPPVALLLLAISLAWFVLGYLTLLRILHRNLATDRYKRQLSRLREWFVARDDADALAALPYPPYRDDDQKGREFRFGHRGGYAELVGFINALIAAAIGFQLTAFVLSLVTPTVPAGAALWLEGTMAVLGLLVAWRYQRRLAAKVYSEETTT